MAAGAEGARGLSYDRHQAVAPSRVTDSTMAITHVFAGIPVSDHEAALEWYERLLGRPPDRIPTDGDAVWALSETGLIYVVRDAPRAGGSLVTLIVDDLDAWIADVSARGITAGEIDTVPGAVRRTAVTDPDGNRITVGEVPRQD
jgi:predicted enzyme related to lactoylglutathione lyase